MNDYEVEFVGLSKDVHVSGFRLDSFFPDQDDLMKSPEITKELNGDESVCKITVKCDHSERESTAEWFNETVFGNKKKMIHTKGGPNPPNKMYCAFQGALTINGVDYHMAVGMNSRRSYNRWNIASDNILAGTDEHDGWLLKASTAYDVTYRVVTSGSNTFEISVY